MIRNIAAIFSLFIAQAILAQTPWKATLSCKEEKIDLHLDLYEESIEVPGMEMFGPMNGYMNGNIYGVWTITSFEIKSDQKATIKISNDLGSETQQASLVWQNDSICKLKFEGHNCVKRVNGKKLVPIPSELKLTKTK